ncbi:MAG TPA: type II secretion system F family protein, partial [Chakrabartia sp.]|nr:type II secretion system F family protein [Chakrabartia sp.]
LPDALAREPRSFDPLYRAIIASGDSAGRLVPTLERLALLIERQAAIRARVQGALAYPAVLAVIALGVVAALMIFVVPRMVEQFDQAGAPLPLITRIVMGLSLFLAHWWGAILLLLAIVGVAVWLALRNEARHLAFDRALLRLPLFGRMLRDLHAARFARTLATMVSARLPLVEGLALARDTVRNRAQRAALSQVIEQVRAGGSLAAGMAQSGLFPPLLTYLAASGESSGQLDAMLERAADTLEREFDGSTAVALALLEPAVIVMMGLVVALIILSVLLPVLQMESLVAL